jgi:hypothetical protein
MSHFSSLQTNISEIPVLLKTLDSLKLNWSKEKLIVNNYNGESIPCEIVIKHENKNEIGFSKIGSVYKLVYDEIFWQQSLTIKTFNDQISSAYSYNLITTILDKEGFKILENVKETNYGNVKIKLNALRFV